MQIRRAHPGDLAAVGEVTVAAYAEFAGDDTEEYVQHLRDDEVSIVIERLREVLGRR